MKIVYSINHYAALNGTKPQYENGIRIRREVIVYLVFGK
jgi:hypothetical protein